MTKPRRNSPYRRWVSTPWLIWSEVTDMYERQHPQIKKVLQSPWLDSHVNLSAGHGRGFFLHTAAARIHGDLSSYAIRSGARLDSARERRGSLGAGCER